MVAYINSTREPGQPEVRHDHFLAKVPTVLGFSASPKFLGQAIVPISNGATRSTPVYNFPRREAMLMAMSYSYKLQATVFDAWEAAEAKLAAQAQAAKVAVLTPPEALSGVKTMSSVEIVEVINAMREPGKAVLMHFHFTAKIESHPGIAATNFRGSYLGGNGKQEPCYYLPKREAELNFP